MPYKGPHISISTEYVVNRILRVNLSEFEDWPDAVRRLASAIAEELFLVVCNPFVDAKTVHKSVEELFGRERQALAHHYATSIGEGITMFWSAHAADVAFKEAVLKRLTAILHKGGVDTRPAALVENSTDSTDLRMELPMLVVTPQSAEEVLGIVQLANEQQFALIPRGGGSGATGGAVPARKRTVIVNMGKMIDIDVDADTQVICCGAGVITQDGINAAHAKNLLFTVDPASKTASSIGGNVSENAGGPFAFEYGTTLDNLLSWRVVTPTGELVSISRINHPRHKIMTDDQAEFEVKDSTGAVKTVIRLGGDEIRLPGLGKDVTNKALGGLPGVQKEGVDGIIVDACFILHPKPEHSRVMVLEFFGRSMKTATLVVKDIVALRNVIRDEGDHVKVSAFEEFNSKYVRAIEYKKKSGQYDGDPISVFILQLDGDDVMILDRAVRQVVDIVTPYEGVDVLVAKDAKEAELFWEDRHRLSAIARRTSGFKINEDIVIPIDAVPEFAAFLEQLNLEYAALAYRTALQKIGRLPGMPLDDKDFNKEFTYASKVLQGGVSALDVSDQEFMMQAAIFLGKHASHHPNLAKSIEQSKNAMLATVIEVASHMHAGDGNCHVNIPVNSNDPEMMHHAEEAAGKVMQKAQELGGEVSGEHGIGITKIAFLKQEKMDALREFKAIVDPREILNPGKLVQRELPVRPYTFSFNRLIADIGQSGLQDKERLIDLLENVQICTRCGKCKQVCPMFAPQQSLEYHPRNKNMVLGALVEALYYSQINHGKPDAFLLEEVRKMMEHCTGCGKCSVVCPVKINSSEVTLSMRAILEDENAGGHPIKRRVLQWLNNDLSERAPKAAKAAAFGQQMMNRTIGLVPAKWRERIDSPLFSGKGPGTRFTNLAQSLQLKKQGTLFVKEAVWNDMQGADRTAKAIKEAVLYFPGCGAGLFYRDIGLAGISMLLEAGVAVALPEEHVCCGYPLLAAGAEQAFIKNKERTLRGLQNAMENAEKAGFTVTHILTACGSCRDGIQRYVEGLNRKTLVHKDIMQFAFERLPALPNTSVFAELLYHAPCHSEWVGVKKTQAGALYSGALQKFSNVKVKVSPGCCGESGMGAMTSPAIFNKIRSRKKEKLEVALQTYDNTAFLPVIDDKDKNSKKKVQLNNAPVIVGCPSCKIGIGRVMLDLGEKRPVLHTVEWLASQFYGNNWMSLVQKAFKENLVVPVVVVESQNTKGTTGTSGARKKASAKVRLVTIK